MNMRRLLPKISIATIITLASVLQGWPLLVASVCTMPGAETMIAMEGCCCCQDAAIPAAPAFSACSPGASLAGVLITDPSLQPVNDKNTLHALPLSPVFANNAPVCSRQALSFASQLRFEITLSVLLGSPPPYLLDSVFRI